MEKKKKKKKKRKQKQLVICNKNQPQNNSKTVTDKHHKEIPQERYISPKKWQKIIDDLRLI